MTIVLGSQKGIFTVTGIAIAVFVIGFLIGYNVVGEAVPDETETSDHHMTNHSGHKMDNSGHEMDHSGQKMDHPMDHGDMEHKNMDDMHKTANTGRWASEKYVEEELVKRIDSGNIGQNLRYLSEKPHLAATPRDEELANFIRDRWAAAGFDSAELVQQNFLLSRPDPNNPNKVTLRRGSQRLFESRHKEEPIHENDEDPNFIHAFNAYTPAATVTTAPGVGVVYVNYGRIEDFKQLKQLGVNISGHIAMVRYGKIYRGNKIKNAHTDGAVGVIIFSDPEDVAAEGTSPSNVYDYSWWLPGTGMQRGSTYLGDGDPLTPGWPSTEHAYRIDIGDADLPKIPSQPIGYSDAEQILMRMDGDIAPEEWRGGLVNITYRLGPFFGPEDTDTTLTLSTHNADNVYSSYNVIGVIKGSIEPDRYVMIGNHRDAWGYGAVDPSSGTAQLLETSRVFGTLLSEGWRPRRTIVFCSWGSEEYGLIGSTEYVEEHVNKLQSRAVAYINTDTCASGPMIQVKASPMLWDIFDDITKKVPGVSDSSRSIYDEWMEYSEKIKPDEKIKPNRGTLGSGSDHAHFSFYAGIPAADLWFRRDTTKYNISMYPSYHTGYETFYMMERYMDPGFKIMQGCGRVASLFLRKMSESNIIPYSIQRFPNLMLESLLKSKNAERLKQIYPKYDELLLSVRRFVTAAKSFQENINEDQLRDPLQVRAVNDQMMKLEQSFIMPSGLPGRPSVRHAIFAPSQFDNYASAGFPGLTDLLFDYDELSIEEKEQRNKEIMRHISDLTIMTDMAVSLLKPLDVI